MKRVLLVLAACGSSPKHGPPSPAPPSPVPAVETTTPSPAPPPAVEARVEPTRYDAEQCKQRTATFEQRATAAWELWKRYSDLGSRMPMVAEADADLAPDVVVRIVDSDTFEVSVAGKRVASGQARTALAAVKKHVKAKAAIGIEWAQYLALTVIGPFLEDLQKLGPLAVAVGVRGAPYAPPTDTAPPSALQRYRSIQAAEGRERTQLLWAAHDDAMGTCAALATATKKIVSDGGADKGFAMAAAFPRAVAQCGCRDVDVDTLELFTLLMLAMDSKSVTVGYLDLRLDPAGASRLADSAGLERLSREERRAGVAILGSR